VQLIEIFFHDDEQTDEKIAPRTTNKAEMHGAQGAQGREECYREEVGNHNWLQLPKQIILFL
jgi:hypothetical protein